MEELHAIGPVHGLHGSHVLAHEVARFFIFEIGGGGGGQDGAAADVVEVPDHKAVVRGPVILPRVGEQLIGEGFAVGGDVAVANRGFKGGAH